MRALLAIREIPRPPPYSAVWSCASREFLSMHYCMEPARRLDREDWTRFGLVALGKEGSSVLKADTLAKRLRVSRGSFYWHFKDLADYHAAVLALWEEAAVDRPYAASIKPDEGASLADLDLLVEKAFTTSIGLEAAVFAWGKTYTPAADAFTSVNAKRFDLLCEIFLRAGQPLDGARSRAYLLLSAYLGRMHLQEIYPFGNSERSALVPILLSLEDC